MILLEVCFWIMLIPNELTVFQPHNVIIQQTILEKLQKSVPISSC
jgi:hypothetical protein